MYFDAFFLHCFKYQEYNGLLSHHVYREKQKKDHQNKRKSSQRSHENDLQITNSNNSSYSFNSYQNTGSVTTEKEAYFEKLRNENAMRPELVEYQFLLYILLSLCKYCLYLFICRNVPPNQGGKYAGFGYTMESMDNNSVRQAPAFMLDNAVSSLTTVIFCYSFNKMRFYVIAYSSNINHIRIG